jgi:hypothetical protein
MHKINLVTGESIEFDSIEHIPIAESIKHPNYNAATTNNDYWMIRLQWASTLYSGDAIALDTLTDDLVLGSNSGCPLVTMGFGTLASGGSTPNVMQKVVVNYVSNADCVSPKTGYASSEITSAMLCATLPGKDSCQVSYFGLITSAQSTRLTLYLLFDFYCAIIRVIRVDPLLMRKLGS